MWNHLAILCNDFKFIFASDRTLKMPWRMLVAHLRLKLTQKLCEIFKIKKTSEHFLGLTMHFADYGWFAHLWREIFILENYAFKAPSSSPAIIDAGANIGASVLYFKLIYPNSKITAFEPDPDTFKWLTKNVEANNFKNVELVNLALAEKDGPLVFYRDTQVEGSGVNSRYDYIIPGDKTKIEVEAVRLSPLLHEHIDLLKVDIEGGEYGVFEEAKDHLGKVMRIFLEVHQGEGAKNDPIHALLTILDQADFRYGTTTAFITHSDFVSNPKRQYALMLDAERVS